MSKYRRIEINAYHRRVTVVSGEWPREVFDEQPARTEEGVSLDDSDSCEPVEPDSPEGQMILVEAVRSLEQRLSPGTRATICTGQNILAPKSKPNSFCLKLRSFYESICPKPFRLIERRNETLAQRTAKQSGKD